MEHNPKDAVGIRKAGTHYIPNNVVMKLGLALQEGARKYGAHNWRVAGVRASIYYDAAMRHLMAWWEGEDIDPDSGLSHLIKAMACFTVIQDAIDNNNWVDDRPPSLPNGWQSDLNKKASDLIDRLPNSKEPYVKGATPLSSEPEIDYSKAVPTNLGFGHYQAASRAPQTTPVPPSPSPDNPVQPLSAPGYIDPKQREWSPLLEREVPLGSAGKSQGG